MKFVKKLFYLKLFFSIRILRFGSAIAFLYPFDYSFTASALDYPYKPVRIIVAVSAGGPTDLLARAIGQKLSEIWHQTVVIDNRSGGGSNIGMELAAKSPADGYTLLMAPPAFAVNASLYKKLAYDPIKDFAAVSLVATYPLLLVVHPSMPFRTVSGLVSFAKTTNMRLNYASAGNGTAPHLAAEWFKHIAGIELLHIPYRGAAPAMVDLMGGHAQMAFTTPPAVLAPIEQGRLVPIALTSSKRIDQLPQTPTFSESGYPQFIAMGWYGMVVPAGTPAFIIAKLQKDTLKVLEDKTVLERLKSLGLDAAGSSSIAFSIWIKQEINRWASVVKLSGAQVD